MSARIKVVFNDGCEVVQGIIPVNSVEGVSRNINQGQLLRCKPLYTIFLQQSSAFESNYTIDEAFFLINTLSSYYNTWKIEALVGTKSEIRYLQNSIELEN
ncbi:21080_t:CDS:1, partial [Gigaspora rosea]